MAYQSTTIKAIRQQVGTELGLMYVIPNGDFTSVQAGGITSLRRLANVQWGPGYWAGLDSGVFRPDAATSADYWRFADQLNNSSGALTITGTYSDQTVGSEVAELWKKAGTVFSPAVEILNAINYCLQFETFASFAAFSHGDDNDFDMAASVTTAYSSSNATLTKSTTASRTPFGLRSLRVANSGSDGYAQSASILPTNSVPQQISAWGIVSVAAQTASMTLYNATGSASMASLTTAQSDPQVVNIPWTSVPASSVSTVLRLGGASASCDAYWNAIWLYKQDELRFNFPGYVSERFKVKGVFYGRPIGTTTSANTSPARGLEFIQVDESDYQLLFNHGDANPYGLQLDAGARWLMEWPLFVQVMRPFSDLGTFSGADETQTTAAPLHTLIPRVKLHLLDHVLIPGYPDDRKWVGLRAIAQKELDNATQIRVVEPVASIPFFAGIGRV